MSHARLVYARCAVLGALLAGVSTAGAETESVGRTRFELPSPPWQAVGDYQEAIRYQSGTGVPLTIRLYQLPGASARPKALLMVSSTSGSHGGRTQWSGDACPEPRARFFATDFGTGKLGRSRQCLVVNAAFVPKAYFAGSNPALELMRRRGIELPASAYSLRSSVANENGAVLRVHLITDKNFVGLPNANPDAQDLHGVAPALVAWAEALHDSAKGSVRRVSGNLELPPVHFLEDK